MQKRSPRQGVLEFLVLGLLIIDVFKNVLLSYSPFEITPKIQLFLTSFIKHFVRHKGLNDKHEFEG